MTANISRRTLLTATGSAALIGATSRYDCTPERPDPAALLKGGWQPSRADKALVGRWARDTWRSLVAMTDEKTGLPADNIGDSVTNPVRSNYTSPTNIGGYLWSTVVARHLGIISPQESLRRITQTLTTMSQGRPPRARAACTSTGTTRRPARSCTPTRTGPSRSRRSCRVSTTAGSRAR